MGNEGTEARTHNTLIVKVIFKNMVFQTNGSIILCLIPQIHLRISAVILVPSS